MSRTRGLLLAPALTFVAGCAAGPAAPAALDAGHEMCGSCRMVVSNVRTASQIVAPAEEPVFFDDLKCLRAYRAAHALPAGAVVYVADHRTGEWVRADRAVFTRTAGATTAMGSGVIAHASDASRAADQAAAGGAPVPIAQAIAPGDAR